MKVLVTGGSGYIGAMLVPWLLADGHMVTVVDTEWFGSGVRPGNEHLTFLGFDIRKASQMEVACKGQDAVIHLASISAEAMCQRYETLARSVNVEGTGTVLMAARKAKVGRFIFASSVAAYGSGERNATEDAELNPATVYGNHKRDAEAVVLDFIPGATIVRAASVCGYSVHQRLDLTVNKMTHDAVRGRCMVVNGGRQKRCHIHIYDICRAYRMLLEKHQDEIAGETFNFVAQNSAVIDTAAMVAEETHAEIKIGPPTDNRSYTVDGTKVREVLGFKPMKTVRQAVKDLVVRLDAGYWKDAATNPVYRNEVILAA